MTNSPTTFQTWERHWRSLDDLARLAAYADAQDFSAFIQDRIDALPKDSPGATSGDPLDESPMMLQALRIADASKHRDQGKKGILTDLMAGRLALIGVIQGSNDCALQLVPPQFAFAADVTYFSNLKKGDVVFERLKVLAESPAIPEAGLPKPADVAARQSEDPRSAVLPTTKVPPPNTLRPLAIQTCYDERRTDFHDMNLTKRTAVYLAWIEQTFPACDTTKRFSESSFEADETAFKKKRGLTGS